MERYIDADLLLERIYPYNGVDKSKYAINAKAVFEAIRKSPTADVVPKSEVEKLQAEAESLRNANADLALSLLYECTPTKEHLSELEKAVRDKVAREIFEEIEREFCGAYWYKGYTIERYIAELKKKYTEEKSDE